MIESIGPIFKDLHGFTQGQIGLTFLGLVYVRSPNCPGHDVKKLIVDVELGLAWDS